MNNQHLPKEVKVFPNVYTVNPYGDDSNPEEDRVSSFTIMSLDGQVTFYNRPTSDLIRQWLEERGYKQITSGTWPITGRWRRD